MIKDPLLISMQEMEPDNSRMLEALEKSSIQSMADAISSGGSTGRMVAVVRSYKICPSGAISRRDAEESPAMADFGAIRWQDLPGLPAMADAGQFCWRCCLMWQTALKRNISSHCLTQTDPKSKSNSQCRDNA